MTNDAVRQGATGSAHRRGVAELLVATLAVNGVERVFLAPGASRSAVLEALADGAIDAVTACHGSGAAHMAEATAKVTGGVGVCMIARARDAGSAVGGVQLAAHDGTPMILFVGRAGRGSGDRGDVRETDVRALFSALPKWVAEIDDADRVVETVNRAFVVAASGRPGPVVLVLADDVATAATAAPSVIRPVAPVETHPGAAQMWDLQKRLWAAKRPIVLVGGARWSEKAVRQFARFAEKFELPVACGLGRRMLFDPLDPQCAGTVGIDLDPALAARIRAADLVVSVGAETAGDGLLDGPSPTQTLVLVHVDPAEFGRDRLPDLAIHASPSAFAAAVEALEPPPAGVAWRDWTAEAHADHLAWSEGIPAEAGGDRTAEIRDHLRAVLADDAIVTSGVGTGAARFLRVWHFRRHATEIAALSGAIGYALPAAIAAKLAHPARTVLAVCGGDDLLAASQELATARRTGAAVVVIVFDDRLGAAAPAGPDFAALARAHGAHGATVAASDAFGPVFDAALAHGGPALIHVIRDPAAARRSPPTNDRQTQETSR